MAIFGPRILDAFNEAAQHETNNSHMATQYTTNNNSYCKMHVNIILCKVYIIIIIICIQE